MCLRYVEFMRNGNDLDYNLLVCSGLFHYALTALQLQALLFFFFSLFASLLLMNGAVTDAASKGLSSRY